MKKASGIVVVALLFLSTLATAQSDSKIGVMNVLQAIVECSEGKHANDEFQKKYEAKREELSQRQKELEALQQQLRSQSSTLSDDSRAALVRSVEVKTTELQRAQEDAEKDFNDLRNQIFGRIGSKMAPLVQQYAKENNFTLIIDSSSQATQLSYIDPAVDITQEVIKRFDRAQVSGGSSTPAAKPPATATPKAPAPAARPPATAPKK